jgi:hypothetical protein
MGVILYQMAFVNQNFVYLYHSLSYIDYKKAYNSLNGKTLCHILTEEINGHM